MAVKTSAIIPFPVTSIPDRLTMLYVADPTRTTTTAGTGAVVRLNRVQSANFGMDTPVTEVSEMGTQSRVGGIDELGEAKWKIDFNAVNINNLAALTGKKINATAASVTTIGLTDFQTAKLDIIRLVADPQNNVFGTLYMQDCVIEDYTVDVKVKGLASESLSGKGPNATFFPGYIIPKVYVVQAADVTSNSIPLSGVLGADEAPVQIFTPAAGQPPSYWQQNGSSYFLKVEQVTAANAGTIVGGASGNVLATRYYESGSAAATTVTYNSGTKVLAFPSGAIAAGDVIRLVFCSYNTDSFPTSIPATAPDTADRAGITARVIPIKINALGTSRIQSASVKFSLKRDHVQGVGENTLIYGIPSIPDVTIDLDVKESDPSLVSLLSTGSKNLTGQGGTIANDFQDLNYATRYELANALPFEIDLLDPFSVGVTLAKYTTTQLVVKGIDYTMSNKSDNTVKVSAMDIIGTLNISYTHP